MLIVGYLESLVTFISILEYLSQKLQAPISVTMVIIADSQIEIKVVDRKNLLIIVALLGVFSSI